MTLPLPDQRCIDLYDNFTHGTMSRRDAAGPLAKLAWGDAADLVWGRTVEFLKRYLAG